MVVQRRHILTISRDEPLQQTRTLLLEQIGYAVTPMLGDAAVHDFLQRRPPPHLDLVLMCHSVPERSRIKLCDALKLAYPDTPIFDALQRVRSDGGESRRQTRAYRRP